MRIFHFDKHKFNFPLKMELGKIQENPNFFSSEEIHCTDFFEIMIFEEDAGQLLLDSRLLALKKGSFLFISPFQKRSWKKVTNLRGWFLIFEKDFLNEFFSDDLFAYRLQFFYNQQMEPIFQADKKGELFSFQQEIFEEITAEIQQYQQDSPHLLRALLYFMLIKMNRAFCAFHNLENNTQLNSQAYRFKALLEDNIRQYQKVNDYALLMQTSRVSLNKSVQQQFYTSASEMIKERLIQEIKTELLFGNKNISEIAYALHFSEPNNLIRFFKNRVGISPKKYRVQELGLSN